MAQNIEERRLQQHTDLRQQLRNISEGSLCDLQDNNKRWLLVGIGLNTVMAPVLRNFVQPRLDQLWLTFNNQHNISVQQYPNQMACYNTTYFNYEAINNNVVHGWKRKENFNYCVKDSVDLSKLFLHSNMTKYSAFDDSCDLSALLMIIIKSGVCSSLGVHFAEKLKDQVRNPWAHCSYSLWDQTKYTESIDIMENLVVNLGLSPQEEHDMKSKLELWKQKGKKFIDHNSEVIADVSQQVQELVNSAERIVVDTPDQMKKLKDELIGMLSNHENRLQKIEKTLFTKETLPCLKRKTDEEDKKRMKVEDSVPWNVRRRIEQMIENWKVDNKTYVVTAAVEKILKCVQKNQYITITGNSGMGKTATLRHVVLQLVDKGYDVIPVHESRDVDRYYNPDKITLFVVDDFCGKFSAEKTEVEKWKRFLDFSANCLNDHFKIVVACRLQVLNDDLFKTIPEFQSCVCNLLTKDYRISNIELQTIASMYLGSDAEKVTELVSTYDCFPLICKLYKQSPYNDLTVFFFKTLLKCTKKNLNKCFLLNTILSILL